LIRVGRSREIGSERGGVGDLNVLLSAKGESLLLVKGYRKQCTVMKTKLKKKSSSSTLGEHIM